MGWKTGKRRPARPLQVTIDGVAYVGWVGQIFKQYMQRAGDKRLSQGWENRVWGELQKVYPHYIINATVKPPPPQVSISTILSFVNFVRKRGWNRELVDEKVAKDRAEICAKCPKAGVITGCSKCKGMIQAIIKTPDMKLVPPDKAGCTVCGCFNDVKVWIPSDQLEEEAGQYDWWEECWMIGVGNQKVP